MVRRQLTSIEKGEIMNISLKRDMNGNWWKETALVHNGNILLIRTQTAP